MKKEIAIDFIKNSILNSSLQHSRKIYKVFNMAFERGIDINFRLVLEDYNNLEMGFGLKAAEPIYENKEIMRIPVVTGFNGLDLIDFKEDISKKAIVDLSWKIAKTFFPDSEDSKKRQEKSFQNLILFWQLLLNSYQKDAYNHHFVDSFPDKDLTQPVYASDDIFNLISSRNLKKYYFDNKLFLHSLYNYISREKIHEVTFNEIAWAYNNVISRKIIIPEESNLKNIYQLIMPIADYINHSSTKANCYAEPVYESESKSSYISLKADKNIQENEQLFFDYGPMYNKKLMSMYGFFDSENPMVESDFLFIGESNYFLPFLEIPSTDILTEFYNKVENNKEFKVQLMNKHSINYSKYYPQFSIILYLNKFDTNFLKFLRIIFLDDQDISHYKDSIWNHDFDDIYSFQNEKKVYSYIEYVLNRHLSFVKHINHDDFIKSLGTIDSLDKFKTKSMWKLEQEEKVLLEKNLIWVTKKMKSLN
jgi:hypothetical protein